MVVPSGHAGGPAERVKALLDRVISIQTDPQQRSRETRRASIREAMDQSFDFDRMAAQAMGSYWENLSPAQQSEFKGVFEDLFKNSYSTMVLENLGKEEILYEDEEIRETSATVKTVMLRRNERLPIDYRLVRVKGAWLIQDVTIDGVSILRVYQESFASAIRRDSYAVLIEKMREKAEEIERTP